MYFHAGVKIGEAINKKRMTGFMSREIESLPLSPDEAFFVYPVVRFDNFFFQKRFIFVVSGDKVYIKKQLDKKSNWMVLNKNEIRSSWKTASFWDKLAVIGCKDLIFIKCHKHPNVFGGGSRFFVELKLGEMIAVYGLESTKSLYLDLKN